MKPFRKKYKWLLQASEMRSRGLSWGQISKILNCRGHQTSPYMVRYALDEKLRESALARRERANRAAGIKKFTPRLTQDQWSEALALIASGMSRTRVAKHFGCSKGTIISRYPTSMMLERYRPSFDATLQRSAGE